MAIPLQDYITFIPEMPGELDKRPEQLKVMKHLIDPRCNKKGRMVMVHRTSARLFEDGDFTSHAGLPLKWKLECDAISPDEWRCIAKMIMDYQTESFSKSCWWCKIRLWSECLCN